MEFTIRPIGLIRSERLESIDDHWNQVRSFIELTDEYSSESIRGLEDFSHIEIVYYFHKVKASQIVVKAEHPRENPNYPLVGIFAQRKKSRPNLLGLTISEIDKIEDKKIFLKSCDAIDGTPVIDIKPVFKEFLPKTEIKQPVWVSDLMKDYWE